MNVWLVEDVAYMRKCIADLLSEIKGVTITGFTEDVESTIDALATSCPDLVILDIGLKSSSGSELIGYIASSYPATQIFVFSFLESDVLREGYLKAGAHDVFDKASEFLAMADAISALSRRRKEYANSC